MSKVGRLSKQRRATILCDQNDIFIVYDGVKIAKRGYPGTPEGKTWISLKLGWSVRDRDGGNTFEVEHGGVPVQFASPGISNTP
jgi:hypothetical protein